MGIAYAAAVAVVTRPESDASAAVAEELSRQPPFIQPVIARGANFPPSSLTYRFQMPFELEKLKYRSASEVLFRRSHCRARCTVPEVPVPGSP